MNNLFLTFQRTENYSTGQEIVVTGSISYSSNPEIFVFTTSKPVDQISYTNSDGTFILDNNEPQNFEEGASVLEQTKNSILSWFEPDCNLSKSGYIPIKTTKENDFIVSKWAYNSTNLHPIESITVYSDNNGVFKKLIMYTENNVLFTESELSDFKYNNGFYFPTKIISKTYQDNKPFVTTTLQFFDYKINQNLQPSYLGKTLAITLPEKTIFIPYNYSKASKPEDNKYNTSITSVSVNWSYIFYKKFITNQDTSRCPYTPSCSQYMLQAVSKNGVWGIIQGLERLKRCTKREHSKDIYITLENGSHYDPIP